MIDNLVILPYPVEFFLMKGTANDDLITSAVFPGMEEEAYRIRAEEKGITILAGSEKGLKRAEASLSQIRLQCYFGGQAAVPCFRLYDRPKQTERIFRTAGSQQGPEDTPVHKTTALLQQEIRIAAFLKYNVFELVMPGACTAISALEETCREFGMEFRCTEGSSSEPGEKAAYDQTAELRQTAERAEALWCRTSSGPSLTEEDHRAFPESDDPGFRKRFDRLLPFFEMILDPEDPGQGDLIS